MTLKLSDHFTYKRILRITIAPIAMMVFTSIYTIVDGIFVSNFAGNDAFAGLNLIYPVIMIVGCVGFIFGAGGTALVSKLLGEQKKQEANETFSLLIYVVMGLGLALSIAGFFLVRPIAQALKNLSDNATEEMVNQATIYGRILMLGQPLFMIQNMFQSFFVCAERPGKGFLFAFIAGITNMALDALLVGVLGLQIVGAAVATIISYGAGAIGPLLYFAFNKNLPIRLGKAKWGWPAIAKSMSNGVSEFITNVSTSVVAVIYNTQLLLYFGQDGVSAYGITAYVSFVFCAMFFGYNIGIAPVVGYNYGAQNKPELQSILKKSLIINAIAGVIMCLLGLGLSTPFAMLFSSSNPDLIAISEKAMRIFSLTYLLCGFSIFFSAFFTALNNGLISGIISILRTLVFQIAFVMILPLLFGGDGIWWSCLIAEVAAFILSFVFMFANARKYGYLPQKRR